MYLGVPQKLHDFVGGDFGKWLNHTCTVLGLRVCSSHESTSCIIVVVGGTESMYLGELPCPGCRPTTQWACVLDSIKGQGRLTAAVLCQPCQGLFLCSAPLPCCPTKNSVGSLKPRPAVGSDAPLQLQLQVRGVLSLVKIGTAATVCNLFRLVCISSCCVCFVA